MSARMLGEFFEFLVSDITSPPLRQRKRAANFTSTSTSYPLTSDKLVGRARIVIFFSIAFNLSLRANLGSHCHSPAISLPTPRHSPSVQLVFQDRFCRRQIDLPVPQLTMSFHPSTIELKDDTVIVVLGASGDLAKKKTVRVSLKSTPG